MITHPALAATNVLVKDEGHLSILLSPTMARGIAAARPADRPVRDRLSPLG